MDRLRHALVAALVCVGLAGCTDEPKPDLNGEPSPSVSPTESESTSTSPTEEPLGPEETVRAWVEARNLALQDSDTSEAEALSAPNCRTCVQSLEPIRDVYANGGHYETTGWRVAEADVAEEAEEKAVVNAGVVYAAGTTVPAEGEAPVSYGVERHLVEFRLARNDGIWQIAFIGYLS